MWVPSAVFTGFIRTKMRDKKQVRLIKKGAQALTSQSAFCMKEPKTDYFKLYSKAFATSTGTSSIWVNELETLTIQSVAEV